MNSNIILPALMQFLIVLLGISFHEAAHGWTAMRCGDATAWEAGRVSLNPMRHLDIFGSVLVPAVLAFSGGPVFGWGRPTPVRVDRLANPQKDHLLVTLAGPLSNLLLAAIGLVFLAVSLGVLGTGAAETATSSLIRDFDKAALSPSFPLIFTCVQFAFLNGFLALFNLLPIPPLDGGQLVLHLLPPEWAARYSALRPYGFMIVLGLAILNVLVVLVVPVYIVIALVISVSS
ncbi:MAG: site-2 protease family protein [Acidobacteriota bacterium]|nr:site-2 protease family protein [Acidobacteriota bacterium]